MLKSSIVFLSIAVCSHTASDELTVDQLIKNSKSASPVELASIFFELGQNGEESAPAIPLLIAHLGDDRNGLKQAIPDDSSVGFFASRTLTQIGLPAVPALISTLKEPSCDDTVKLRCVTVIGEIGCRSRQSEELMIKIGVESRDEHVVSSTLHSLATVFVDRKKVASHIVRFFDHENIYIQVRAIRLAGRLRFTDKALEMLLLEKIGDETQFFDPGFSRFVNSPTVGLDAIRSLAEFPELSKRTLESLKRLLETKDRMVAIEAARAIHMQTGLMNQKGMSFIKRILQDESNETNVLGYALQAAGRSVADERARTILPELQRLVKHSDSGIRTAAIKAMSNIDLEKTIQMSETLRDDENEYVRYAAYESASLASPENDRAYSLLKKGLYDESIRNQQLVLDWFSGLEIRLSDARQTLREFRKVCKEKMRPAVDIAISKVEARR